MRGGCGRTGDGQAQLEYLGLLLLMAAVVVAIAASGIGTAVAGGLRGAICAMLDPAVTADCVPAARQPARLLTPLERATRGDYVALGDSYSSGEGGSTFAPGTDQDVSGWESFQESIDGFVPFWDNQLPAGRNMCHRSTAAYSQRVYRDFDFGGDLEFHACGGATIDDMLSSKHEAAQLAHLSEDTSLVTVSIGGNDAGFAEVVKRCVVAGVFEWQESCRESMGATTRTKISEVKDDLVRLYDTMQQRAPNARIIVVGYPRIFPDEAGVPGLEVGPSLEPGDLDEPIDPADQRWMNHMAAHLDQTIQRAARQAGVEYVSVYDALDGHEIGTKESWINDLDVELENGKPWDMGSFHPNDRGQAAIARLVEKQIRNGR